MLLWMESSSSMVLGEAFGCMQARLVSGWANVRAVKISPTVELGEPAVGSWLFDVAARLEAADTLRTQGMRCRFPC